MYGFALRKIIEGVAVGCTVITDLPAYDELPMIDGALVRVKPTINPPELASVIVAAVDGWDPIARAIWAARARAFYDYRALGRRLADHLAIASSAPRTGVPA